MPLEQILLQWWPVLVVMAGVVIWSTRLEGRVNQIQERLDRLHETMQNFYATKNEIAEVKGAINAISVQIPDMKTSLTRIESKIDTFVITGNTRHGSP